MAWFQEDGAPFEPQSGMIPCVGRIRHTLAQDASDLNVVIEEVYQKAIAADQSPSERLNAMAHLHWLLAHQMPDRRGSAAKTELAVRGVGYAVGIELPPFREGIVPDLEAFLNSQEEFVAQYPSMFTRSPLP